jgi:hypothetical protein
MLFSTDGDSGIGNMPIANANVTGNSSTSGNYDRSGIGIGCAFSNGGNLGIGNMTIGNANVTGSSSPSGNYGGSGIGTGYASSNPGKSDMGRLVLSGTLTLICDWMRARSVVISNASIFTPNSRLFETTPGLSGRGLAIFYGTAATDAQESFGGIPYLSIGASSEAFEKSALLPISMTDSSSEAFEKSAGRLISDPIVGSFQVAESDRYLESGEFPLISSSASPIKGLLMTVGLIGALLVLLLITVILVWFYICISCIQAILCMCIGAESN